MAHISSLTAGVYTYLDVFTGDISGIDEESVASDFAALFVGGANADRLPSVREFPAIGNTANITNVPVFGQASSSQVSGQADAPNFEVTVNFVPEAMTAFYALVDSKQQVAVRLMMATAEITETEGQGATISQENTEFYFIGKIEAIQTNPSLTDANTAVVTFSRQGDFRGPATVAAP